MTTTFVKLNFHLQIAINKIEPNFLQVYIRKPENIQSGVPKRGGGKFPPKNQLRDAYAGHFISSLQW